ncbi:BrnT family toxin [Telmatobacter bradus]|uniref:BrnT family toxin n=1 Tax=Telmatobacter bradus TaxID=474953 RepID=UPI003B4381D0
MEITYDPRKSERNQLERGFGFEVVEGFHFVTADYAEDRRRDYGEVRIRAIGFIENTLYALVFTMRGGTLRVISLRRANRKERTQYASSRS